MHFPVRIRADELGVSSFQQDTKENQRGYVKRIGVLRAEANETQMSEHDRASLYHDYTALIQETWG
jgi:hypothetical protein